VAKNIVVTEDENASGTLVTSSKLGELKVAQLRTLAQQLGIKGYLRLKKADLVEAVASHQRGGVVAERDETDAEKKSEKTEKTPSSKAEKSEKSEGEKAPAKRTRTTRTRKTQEAKKAEKTAKTDADLPPLDVKAELASEKIRERREQRELPENSADLKAETADGATTSISSVLPRSSFVSLEVVLVERACGAVPFAAAWKTD